MTSSSPKSPSVKHLAARFGAYNASDNVQKLAHRAPLEEGKERDRRKISCSRG
eukprot:TRINITY_DN3445_c0_g1_i1.p2 TRINITY_DN3445_c0_g1~~TRINITY_DN3445_c0_g1_i1.p2  ORF type:complete len:53 (-),score=6.72 TRINITY_DN3445_c0_g1_i1:37-195(-)